MLTCFFDATYNHPKPGSSDPFVHSVSAYVGSSENWRKFRKEWQRELDRHSLNFFHMTDFEFARSRAVAGQPIPSRNPFNGWNLAQFTPFLRRLHNVINRRDGNGDYRLESWTSSVLTQDFDETIPAELKGDVQCSSYYIFNVLQIMKGLSHNPPSRLNPTSIHYVFSRGDGEDGNLRRLFEDMWKDPTPTQAFRLTKAIDPAGYTLESMKSEPALQAADISAFEMHKAALKWRENEFADTPLSTMRASLTSLGRTRHWGLFYRGQELQKTFEEIRLHNQYYRPMLESRSRLCEG